LAGIKPRPASPTDCGIMKSAHKKRQGMFLGRAFRGRYPYERVESFF